MRTDKQFLKSIALAVLLFSGFATAGNAQDSTTIVTPETKAPVILTTTPTDGEMNVDLNSDIEITFDSEMDATTINGTTLLLHATSADSMTEKHGAMMKDQMKDTSAIYDSENNWQDTAETVEGTISYSNKVAVFTPDTDLKEGNQYTFTVTHGVENLENLALENDHTWSFTATGSPDSTYADMQNDSYSMDRNDYSESTTDTTNLTDTTETTDSAYSDKQNVNYSSDRNQYSESATDTMDTALNNKNNMIDLGKAGQFVILAKTTINNESVSRITGHTGEGSATESLNKEMNDAYSVRQNSLVQNAMVQEDRSDTTSSPDVTEALEDMMTAYSDASMKTGDDSTSQLNENFHDAALGSGVHEWSDSLNIESDVTLSGGTDDVWVFKIGDNLTVNDNTVFTLTDGALAENIFWVVDGQVNLGSNSSFEGIILSENDITLEKGAKLNGRMYSQASITLDDNTVTEPGIITGQTTSTNK